MSSHSGSVKIPREVKGEACTLLDSPTTVASYVKVRDVLALIANKLPSIAEGTAFAKACGDLEKLATKLTQDRYRIGFIGISQGGKSTTAGYVVGAKGDADNPAPPGGGGRAATAIATRIMPVKEKHPQCPPNEDHYVELVYLTKEQLRDRVRQIFDILQIEQAPEQSPQVWLEQCRQHAQTNPKDKEFDREVAIRMLEAAIANPTLVQSSPVTEPGSFAMEFRKKCLLHPAPGEPVSKYALLREMRIWYRTDKAPESLELIDLPGLGVKRKSDETLTVGFLPELNGAFLFYEQHQYESESAATLTEKMRREYGDTIGGRIWVVITKCDLFEERGQQRNLSDPHGKFKTITDETRKSGLTLGNVVLVANPIYQAISGGKTPQEAWSSVETLWKPEFGESGQPVIPAAVTANEGLLPAFRDLVLTGGVPRISSHMKERVEAAIRSETQAEAQAVLTRVVATLRDDLEASKQMGGMTHEQVVSAAIMHRTLHRIAKQHLGYDGHIQAMYERLTDHLETLHAKLGYATDDPDEDGHKVLCTALMQKAIAVAKEQAGAIVDKVQKKVDETMAADKAHASLEKDVPAIKAARQAWADHCQRLKEGKTAAGRPFRDTVFGTFDMPDELAARFQWAGSSRLTGKTHESMMTTKIGVVSRAYASEFSLAIADTVMLLADTYRKLGRDNSEASPTLVADYDAAINTLNNCFS